MAPAKKIPTPERIARLATPKVKAPAKKNDVIERWGGNERIFSRGFVAVPVLLLERMASFKPHALTPAEALFVICVMAHKWDERDPFPSYKRIATWMGKSESYVRRLAKNLETKKLMKREARIGQTNSFDFDALFAKLVPADEAPSTNAVNKSKRAAKQADQILFA